MSDPSAAPAAPAPLAAPDVTSMSPHDTAAAVLTGGPSLFLAPEGAPAPAPVAPEPAVAPPAQQTTPEPAAPASPADDIAARIERAMAARAETQERLMRLEQYERDAATRQQEAEQARFEADRLRKMATENLPALLQEHGWTPEAIVQAMTDLHNPRPEQVRGNQLEQRLAQIERANVELREELAARDHATKVAQFKAGIVPALAAKTEAYSHSLAFFDPEPLQQLVFDEIEREYQGSSGRTVLTVEQAADRIESQLRARVSRVKGTGNAATVVPTPAAPPRAPASPAPRTLTNDLNGSTGHAPEFDPSDDGQRLAQAADILRKGWSQT